MPHIEDVLRWAMTQDGDRYFLGAEVSENADDASEWDCSELVEWSCAKAGVHPRVPDLAFGQWVHCKKAKTTIDVDEGFATRGALLFHGNRTGDAISHVAFSLGDGTTMEAKGRKYGVGRFKAKGRFNFAARIPGVDYGVAKDATPPLREDIDMAHIVKRAGDETGKVFLIDGGHRIWLDTPDAVKKAAAALGPTVRYLTKDSAGNIHPLEWDAAIVNLYPPQRPDLDA